MALSRAYDILEIPTIGEDEPVFILRAQDMLAISAIQTYPPLAEAHGCQVPEQVNSELEAFLLWPGNKKLPGWPAAVHAGSRHRTEPAAKK